MQRENLIQVRVEAVSLDSTMVKVHPGGIGALKKTGRRPSGNPGGMDHQNSYGCRRSSGGSEFFPFGRECSRCGAGPRVTQYHTPSGGLCDHGSSVRGRGDSPAVVRLRNDARCTPKKNRLGPWVYDREIYKKRNEVERLFRRLKGYRRIFSRFDKFDIVFMFFIYFALISDTLFSVNRP